MTTAPRKFRLTRELAKTAAQALRMERGLTRYAPDIAREWKAQRYAFTIAARMAAQEARRPN